jgi:uncharacterized membrane protein
MIELAIIFTFLAVICWGIEDFLAQKSARKIGDAESLAFIMIIGAIIFTPFVIKDIHLLFSKQILWIIALVSVVHLLEGLFYFESLKEGKLAVIDAIFELELPVTVLLGIVFFSESLSAVQFSLIGAIFIGIFLISTKKLEHLKIKVEKGVIMALITAFFLGLVNFSSAFSVRATSPILVVWIVWVTNAIFLLAYLTYKNKDMQFIRDGWKFKLPILIMSVFASLAWVFYFYALKDRELSIITAITEIYPIIPIFLGLFINREKINFHQYIGIGLALLAAVILAFI